MGYANVSGRGFRRIWRVRLRLALAASVAACTGGVTATGLTSPTLGELQASRAAWVAQAPTHYSYAYEMTGFFNAFAGRAILVEVRNDTVQSATVVATGQLLARPYTFFPPTLDGLFDQAAQALQEQKLSAVRFDPQVGYITRMDIAGPPDASGSVFASALQPLP